MVSFLCAFAYTVVDSCTFLCYTVNIRRNRFAMSAAIVAEEPFGIIAICERFPVRSVSFSYFPNIICYATVGILRGGNAHAVILPISIHKISNSGLPAVLCKISMFPLFVRYCASRFSRHR